MKFEILKKGGTKTRRLNQRQTARQLFKLFKKDSLSTVTLKCFFESGRQNLFFEYKGPVWFVSSTFSAMKDLNQLQGSAAGFNGDFLNPNREVSINPISTFAQSINSLVTVLARACESFGLRRKILS